MMTTSTHYSHNYNHNQASFRKLSMVAFLIAMMGLFGNLLHLHSLTTKPMNEPSDLITHYIMSDENDAKRRQNHQQQQQEQEQQQQQHHQQHFQQEQEQQRQQAQQQRQRRATLLEDPNTNNDGTNNVIREHEDQPAEKPEAAQGTTLLRRLMRESIDSLEACRRAKTAPAAGMPIGSVTAPLNNENAGAEAADGQGRKLFEDKTTLQQQQLPLPHRRRPLARFGWLNTLTNYLATSSASASASASFVNGENSQQQQHEECSIPSSQPACNVQNMSMVVLSQGTDLRRLFVNILSWLLYSSIEEITVLLPTSVWIALAEDVKYGRRLQDWHNDPHHKVHFIPYNQSLWYGISLYYMTRTTTAATTTANSNYQQQQQSSSLSSPNTTAIVFMNGDVRWRGNDEGLHAGLALWQRHPASVVASSYFDVQVLAPHGATPNMPLLAVASSRRTEASTGSLPFCKQYHLQQQQQQQQQVLTTSVEESPAQNGLALPDDAHDATRSMLLDLSGLILHRDYLCLLSHRHAVKALAHFATNFNEAQVAMSVLLTLATSVGSTTISHAPRLYPLRILRRQNVTTTITTISTATATTTTTQNDIPEDSQDNNISPEEENLVTNLSRRRLRSSTFISRLLAEDDTDRGNDEMPSLLDDETITSIVGYFGSLPTKPTSWCKQQGEEGASTTSSKAMMCSHPLKDPYVQDLDWLQPGNPEHDICP